MNRPPPPAEREPLTDAEKASVLDCIEKGCSKKVARDASGISPLRWGEMLRFDIEFEGTMRKARALRVVKAESVIQDGIKAGDAKLARWWLSHSEETRHRYRQVAPIRPDDTPPPDKNPNEASDMLKRAKEALRGANRPQ